jgi:apolipoprotein N-acyltransferase
VTVTDGLSIPVFLLVPVPVYGMYYALFAVLTVYTGRKRSSLTLFTWPALWIILEYIRANAGFLALPWNLMGHTMYNHPLMIGISDITGVYGVSFLIVMVNRYITGKVLSLKILSGRFTSVNVAERAFWKQWKDTVIVAATVATTLAYGAHGLTKVSTEGNFRVAAIQSNSVAFSGMSLTEQKDHLDIYRKLSLEAADMNPELIIWPASSLPAPYRSSRLVRISLTRTAREAGIPLLVGGAGYDKVAPKVKGTLPFSNSQFLVDRNGKVSEQYNKIRLLPFNEYPPLQGIVKWPRFITTITESFQKGEEYTVFEVGEARFSTPICWENNFPDLVRKFVQEGSNLIINVTNEGFMGRTGGPYQTLAISVFRAVENRVPVIRAAPTGISAIIGPEGRIVDRVRGEDGSDLFVQGILVGDVPLAEKTTIYTLYGDVFVFSCAGLFLIVVLVLGVYNRSDINRVKR